MVVYGLFIIGWFSILVNGHSRGSPRHICLAPYPHHDTAKYTLEPQPNDKLPYSISADPETYSEKSKMKITIRTYGIHLLRGILLIVKPKTEDITNPVGSFFKCNFSDIQFYNFTDGINSCLTHSSNVPKPYLMECTYIAPSVNYGTLLLSAVIVKGKKTFWINVDKEIKYKGKGKLVELQNPSSSLDPNETITVSGCGSSKNCILFPRLCYNTNSCKFMVTFSAKEEFVDFELVGPDNDYVALGLSDDTIMKDDFIVVCAAGVKTKSVNIQTGYTTMSHNKKRFRITVNPNVVNRKGGKLPFQSNKQSIMCKFRIPKLLKLTDSDKFPNNLELPLYLFIANGNSFPGTSFAKKHSEPPLISSIPLILYSQQKDIFLYFKGVPLYIQIHGTLMTLAFIIFQPIAIMAALHFRNNLSIQFKTGQLWFNVHIACNLLHVFLSIVGYFYMVFMKKNIFKDALSHGIFGTITMLLTMINVIAGFTRPDLNSSRRFYFYWGHYINGITIRLTGCVTFWLVVYTLNLKTSLRIWIHIILIMWTLGEILFGLIFWQMRLKKSRELKAEYTISTTITFKRYIENQGLIFYIGFLLFISSLLICGLWVH